MILFFDAIQPSVEMLSVVEIRMKSAAAGKTRFFDPPHMIFAA
jgi:hypothetical protein